MNDKQLPLSAFELAECLEVFEFDPAVGLAEVIATRRLIKQEAETADFDQKRSRLLGITSLGAAWPDNVVPLFKNNPGH